MAGPEANLSYCCCCDCAAKSALQKIIVGSPEQSGAVIVEGQLTEFKYDRAYKINHLSYCLGFGPYDSRFDTYQAVGEKTTI